MFLPKNIQRFVISPTIKYLPALSLNEPIGILKILFRWDHSVWKQIKFDALAFIVIYVSLVLLYQLCLQKYEHLDRGFRVIVKTFKDIGSNVPVSFLLGFFVSTILSRWWQIIMSVPWMSSPAFTVMSLLHSPTKQVNPHMSLKEQRKKLRAIRLTIMRYMNMAWIFKVMYLSNQVEKRFKVEEEHESCRCFQCFRKQQSTNEQTLLVPRSPDLNAKGGGDEDNAEPSVHTCQATSRRVTCIRPQLEMINKDSTVKKFFTPLISPEEFAIFEKMEREFHETRSETYRPESWLPLQWAVRILNNALEVGLVRDDRHFRYLTEMIDKFRGSLGQLSMYNEFNMPVGYTQVVVFAMYSFFLSEVISEQIFGGLNKAEEAAWNGITEKNQQFHWHAYIPIFPLLKFIFHMGWFKLGLSLISPLSSADPKGEFPMSAILDYNLQISTQCASADDAIYPEFLTHVAGNANEQLNSLHRLTKIKYEYEEEGDEEVPGSPGQEGREGNKVMTPV